MKWYKKILGSVYFHYALKWNSRTPVIYSAGLLAIINFIQLLSLIILSDILFNLNSFNILFLNYKYLFCFGGFVFFYYLNSQLLKIILNKTSIIQEYSNNRSKSRINFYWSITYILFSILVCYMIAKLYFYLYRN